MPRRYVPVVVHLEQPRKKLKVVEETASADVSFCDDEALPPGIIFTDVLQKKWRIGKPIGRGSFGRIYLASDDVDKEVTKQNARYVVKIEPHTNGPLFVEVHCLIRTAQIGQVKTWRLQKKQKRIGMPVYIASGSFTEDNSDVKYRFLVLPRYDIDLQKIISRTHTLELKNVLVLGLQILDVLEYLHKQGYTHSDIKSSNLMLGFDGSRLAKSPFVKPIQTFQKETKEVSILCGKPRRPKSGKTSYYADEDFVIPKSNNTFKSPATVSKKINSPKKRFGKILSDKDRSLHRFHAFNLRQLNNHVNYEDLNSSVCSDMSYQKLVDDFEKNRNLMYPVDNRFHAPKQRISKKNIVTEMLPPISNESDADALFKEAILSQSNGQIYLLDYGLASKFLDSEGNHKVFGMDARKAHDGTLEYSSRDSHIGAHSRRSDLETLGFNLIDWLTGTLPWKTTEMLAEPDLVHVLKKNFMSDVKSLLKTCFKTEHYPQFLEKFFLYVTSLEFTDRPDYDFCRKIFHGEWIKNNFGSDMVLRFAEPIMSPINRSKMGYSRKFGRKNTPSDFVTKNGVKKAFERENICSLENNLKLELLKQTLNSSSDGLRKPCSSRNFFISDADLIARLKKSLMPQEIFGKKLSPKVLRSNKRNVKKRRGKRTHRNSIGKFGNFMGSARQFTWAEILAGNPEHIIRKDRNTAIEDEDDDSCKYRIRKLSNASDSSNTDNLQSPLMQKDYLQGMNPTYAMKEVLANFRKKISGKSNKECEQSNDKVEGFTPAMVKLLRIKEKREAKELQELKSQNDRSKTKPVTFCVTKRVTRSARKKIIGDLQIKNNSNKSRTKLESEPIVLLSSVDVISDTTTKKTKTKAKSTKKTTKKATAKEKSNNNKTPTVVSTKNIKRSKPVTEHVNKSNILRVTRSTCRRRL